VHGAYLVPTSVLHIQHICVMGKLRAEMPYLWGAKAKQEELTEGLGTSFVT